MAQATAEKTTGSINTPLKNKSDFNRNGIAGVSKGLMAVLDRVRKVSRSDSSVLITGESGTGKELIARAIHKNSARKDGPMVVINCGAIPSELLESELFGHEKGAFTGAHRARSGRFEIADKGTIFLDEIGDMSPDLQVKLLRALQERRFERVGGSQTIAVDIRVISATNKNLTAAIEDNKFREDLYYRLNVIPINILPLRERPEDIMHLVDHFQSDFARRNSEYTPKIFPDSVKQMLETYEWPGNIRELENLVERLSVLVEADTVSIADLPGCMSAAGTDVTPVCVAGVFQKNIGFNEAVESYQRSLITHALNKTGWVKAKAAEMLKMNRTTLVEKIKKMDIEPEDEMPVF
ncbi:sigma-54 interaction domain-containing protein [Desulfobacter latus]|uniref:Sigma-54-dependent Fis family transcriptional regulator n=1 Tax=Desulfobacter latus TaxID=2292 RepID=A0A850T5B3_9BACT|nr:sigma-54 dependent transcriptional regulator [Desulfobacter latus]NWH03488.1 sigma-54-dependent Fis family transcriptional regulator [Desulfobacter latus]